MIKLDNRLPAGPWDARITLRSGLTERTAHATVFTFFQRPARRLRFASRRVATGALRCYCSDLSGS
jgi:hypothetical protein